MSGKQFFLDRYAKLGWQFKELTVQTLSVRINQINAKAKKTSQTDFEVWALVLEKVPFLPDRILGNYVKSFSGRNSRIPAWNVLYSRSSSSNSRYSFHSIT